MKIFKMVKYSIQILVSILLFCYVSIAFSNPYIMYIPIGVGDITVIIPVFNEDVNQDGVPDYDDPSISPEQVFEGFSAALLIGQNETAVKFISHQKRDRYLEAFSNLGSNARKVIEELTNITVISSTESKMEIGANRMVSGELRGYFITLVKNRDNVWRIAEL